MTPAERLRAAATRLRERAGVPYGPPWTSDGTGGVNTAADLEDDLVGPTIYVNGGLYANQNKVAAYIAMMSPPVALALADWLDDLAAGWPWDDDGTCVWDDGTPMRLEESPDTYALAVADEILGPKP